MYHHAGVMEMVARGEMPPDVQDINDKPIPPPEPIVYKGAKEVPPKVRSLAPQPLLTFYSNTLCFAFFFSAAMGAS